MAVPTSSIVVASWRARTAWLAVALVSCGCAFLAVLLPGARATAPHGDLRAELGRLQLEVHALRESEARARHAHQVLERGIEDILRVSRHQAPPHVHETILDIARRARALADNRGPATFQRRASGALRSRHEKRSPHLGTQRILSQRELEDLTRRLDAKFDSEAPSLVDSATAGRSVRPRQAIAIMRACRFDGTRVEVAVLLARRLVAGEHPEQLVSGFNFQTSADTYRRRLGADPRR